MTSEREMVIIAGPTGAEKTTFAGEFLVHEAACPEFIDPDLIAAGLSPLGPDRAAWRAGRPMLREIQRRVRAGESSRSSRPSPAAMTAVGFLVGAPQVTTLS